MALSLEVCYMMGYFNVYIDEYFAGQKSSWNPKYDRLAFWGNITFITLTIMVLFEWINSKYDNFLGYTIFIVFLIVLNHLLIKYVKTERKKTHIKTKEEVSISNKERMINYEIVKTHTKIKEEVSISNKERMIEDKDIVILYHSFRKYQYIDDDIEETEFVQNFLRMPIVLNMKVPLFRCFYNSLEKEFSINIKPHNFVKLFINKSKGIEYDIKQFCKTQNPTPKGIKDLNDILNKIIKRK